MMRNKINYLGPNLKFLRNRKKKNQEDLALALEMTRAKVNSYENGHRINMPPEDLIRVSEYFKISVDALLKRDLSKLGELQLRELEAGNDTYITGTKIRVLAKTVSEDEYENIEIVPLKAKAGYTNGYADPQFIGSLPSFRLPVLSQQRKYRMFQIDGESMHPVPDKSYVIAEYVFDWNEIRSGHSYVLLLKDEGIVFKVVHNFIKESRKLVLHSLNPMFKDYNVDVSEIREVWKFVSYISNTLPEGGNTVDSLAGMMTEMRQELSKIYKKI